MPWQSKRQQRWGHSPAGEKELSDKEIKEFDDTTDFDSLPESAKVSGGKGPTRRQGSGQKTPQVVKDLKKSSRNIHKDVNQKSAGPQSTKKGDKGYNRKEKHKQGYTESEELTMIDETYRGGGFPVAELNWDKATLTDYTECMIGFAAGLALDIWSVPKVGIAADLNWSTHKSETFDDTGEKGEHPAWGMKSIIDRGVKTHEKPKGASKIEDGDTQTQQRKVPSKSFKSYSMIEAFEW